MTHFALRRARVEEALPLLDDSPDTLVPGEYFVEETGSTVRFHDDPSGGRTVAEVDLLDFDGWLARRKLVFLSWG